MLYVLFYQLDNGKFNFLFQPLEQDTYLDQMTDLVAMYIDMELKASRYLKYLVLFRFMF